MIVAVGFIGVGEVSAESDYSYSTEINKTGDPENVYPYSDSQNTTNISIKYDVVDENSEIKLYIDISELDLENVNLSDARISEIYMSGGNVTRINDTSEEDTRVLSITLEPDSISGEIKIQKIGISGINSSRVTGVNQIQYHLGVTSNDSSYQTISESGNTYTSSKFKIAAGSLSVVDQATGSTYFSSSTRTKPGVTISNPDANVDSTIIITRGTKQMRIEGAESYSASYLDGSRNITLESNFGGVMNAFLIPTENVEIIEQDGSEYLAESSINSALHYDDFHSFLGSVRFNNQTFESKIESEIIIAESELRDGQDENTPYIISLHPVTTTGKIKHDIIYGYSDVLTGVNNNSKLYIRNKTGKNNTIWHSNQFAASIRLARGYSEGSNIELTDTQILSNTDVHSGFVENGVSDGSIISVLEEFDRNKNGNLATDNYFSANYSNSTIYGGQTIGFDTETETSENIELNRIDGNNSSIITSLGTHINNSTNVAFNTSNLESGEYYLTGGEFEPSTTFEIVEYSEQFVNISSANDGISLGGNFRSFIHHNTPHINVSFLDVESNSTVATVELATPNEGVTPVQFNTYAARNASLSDELVTVGPGATVESVDVAADNESFSSGAYEIAVRSEYDAVTTTNETRITLQNRSTEEITAYTTDQFGPSEFNSVSAIREAIDTEAIASSSSIRATDTVVYAVNASGLAGLPAARNAPLRTGRDLAALGGLQFGVTPTEPSLATAATTDNIGITPENSSVYLDDHGLYLVAEGNEALGVDDAPADGESFTAAFRVTDDTLRDATSDPDDDHVVSTTLTFEIEDDDTRSDGDDESVGGSAGAGGGGGGSAGGGGGGGSGGGGGGGGGLSGGSSGAAGIDSGSGGSTLSAGRSDAWPSDGVTEGDLPSRNGIRFGTRPAADMLTASMSPPLTASLVMSETESGILTERGQSRSDAVVDGQGGMVTGGDVAPKSGRTTDPTRRTATPTYENAPIRATAEDVPGFGPLAAVVAFVLAGVFAVRRR
ncbi:hypothetical protein GCM10028858_04290 [Halorubrum pallidum]